MNEYATGTEVRVDSEMLKRPATGTVVGKLGGLVRVKLDGGFWTVAVSASSVTAVR